VLLGIDLGTSSVKVVAMAEDGSVKGSSSAGYDIVSPHPRWAETDPGAWWLATRKAVASLGAAHLGAIEGVGVTGQMHGMVLTDGEGRALRPAILWADERSVQEVDLYRRLDPDLLSRLANPLATGMAGPSLMWVKAQEPTLYENARWALQPKDWLRMQLTGEAYGEATDASATLLYDFVEDGWSDDVLRELQLRGDLLPRLIASDQSAGRLSAWAAGDLGVKAGVPVAAGAADVAASLVGHGVLAPGPVVLTIGTGAQMTTVRGELRPDPAMRTNLFRTVQKGRWYSMAAILNAGLALDWVRRLFGVEWQEFYRSVELVPAGADGVSFSPYLVGERTLVSDAAAGASWSGIALHHGREHLLKAALEGVAFALRESLEALEATGVAIGGLHLAGGGAVNAAWRRLLADVLGKRLLVAGSPAGAARGAALLAGVAAGMYGSVEEMAAQAPDWEVAADPGAEAGAYSMLYQRWRGSINPAYARDRNN
jgi:xylulokinase